MNYMTAGGHFVFNFEGPKEQLQGGKWWYKTWKSGENAKIQSMNTEMSAFQHCYAFIDHKNLWMC